MKIAYIVPSLANAGPIIVVRDLVEMMTLHGHDCTVFYFDEIEELEFSCKRKKINFYKSINFSHFDIVHSHGLRPDMYVCIHKPINRSTLCISTMHNLVFKDLSSQYNKLVSIVAGNLWMMFLYRHDKIAVLTHIAKDYYKKWISSKKIYVAHNTTTVVQKKKLLATKDIEELLLFKENNILLGVNASLVPIKGIDLIIKSMPFLNEMKLWIVGKGKSMQDLQHLAKKMNVSERVYFAGYRKDAYRYLQYYDIYVMPSKSEGFPLAMLEAASTCIPTVCSDIDVFKEIFSTEEVAFFKQENIPSLVEAIRFAAGNFEMAKRMHKKYLECYSPEKIYEHYISIYNSIK